MKRLLKPLVVAAQAIAASAILAGGLELALWAVGAPPGASRFVEKVKEEERLSVRKPAGEIRVFTYGESTMLGSQYTPVSSPARWLAAYLADFLPEENVRVVNFARMGHGSEFTLRVFQDTLAYQPDVAVFYLGHNDFLDGCRVDQVAATKRGLAPLLDRLQRTRLASAVSRWRIRRKLASGRALDDRIEQDLIETPPLGLGPEHVVPRSSPLYAENIAFMKRNVLAIARLARGRGIPALFLRPVGNLKDFAPFASLHERALGATRLARWERFYRVGRARQEAGDLSGARAAYRRAYAIDSTHAELCFRLGQVFLQGGELPAARALFERARDFDAIIYRATREMLGVLDELHVARELDLIDAEKAVAAEFPGGIPGEPVIEDNVHFSIRGQALVARRLAGALAERDWIAPRRAWRFERERPFEAIAREFGVNDAFLASSHLRLVHYFGGRFENRIRFARKALALEPDSPRALRHLAWSYWLAGERAGALAAYQRLEQVDSQALEQVFSARPEIRKAFASRVPA